MNKETNVHTNISTHRFEWPQEKTGNLLFLTASALSASLTPARNYYKEAINFLGRSIASRRRLGLSTADYERDLLESIEILAPVGLDTAARKQADELSVNR